MGTNDETRECPFCKEDIKSEAVKCKHCASAISPEKPKHEGTCPYCKEDIQTDAVKCKHCKSDLNEKSESGCGCNGSNDNQTTSRRLGLHPDAGKWYCSSSGTMHCADANGWWHPCGSCIGGYRDEIPSLQSSSRLAAVPLDPADSYCDSKGRMMCKDLGRYDYYVCGSCTPSPIDWGPRRLSRYHNY